MERVFNTRLTATPASQSCSEPKAEFSTKIPRQPSAQIIKASMREPHEVLAVAEIPGALAAHAAHATKDALAERLSSERL